MNDDAPIRDCDAPIRWLAGADRPMRVIYRGGREGLHALVRELEAEGVNIRFTSPTDKTRVPLVVEIRIEGDEGSVASSDALEEAVRWAVANFREERPWDAAMIAED